MQKTAESGRIGYLDGWRGLAILFVLGDHFSRGLAGWAGGFGVELFFALSGLLMAEILFVRHAPLPTFFFRRFSRVYPALFLFATALFVASAVLQKFGLPKNLGLSPAEYITGITFTSNYYQIFTGTNSVLGHLWSLSVEEHTYILLAIIAVACKRKLKTGAIVVALLAALAMLNGIIQSTVLHESAQAVYWRTDVRMASILSAAACHLWTSDRRFPAWTSPALGLCALLTFIFTRDTFCYSAGTIFVAFAVNGLRDTLPVVQRFLANRALQFVGLVSFSLYLWQQPFYKVAERVNLLATPVLLILAFACSYASYRIVEGPVRLKLNDWWRQRNGPGKEEQHSRDGFRREKRIRN